MDDLLFAARDIKTNDATLHKGIKRITINSHKLTYGALIRWSKARPIKSGKSAVCGAT